MADYSGLYAAIGARLGKPPTFWTPTPDALMVSTVAAEVTLAMAQFPCITSPAGDMDYDHIAVANKALFDTGMVEVVADILGRRLNATANDGQGQIVEESIGPDRTKYATPQSGDAGTDADAAARNLGWPWWRLMPCVAAALAARETYPKLTLAGRRRTINERRGACRGPWGIG